MSGKAVVLTAAVLVAGSATVASAAYDAVNADKVDGKHAVSSTASTAQAKGRLVAHDKSGKLPAKFIPKVRDADRLDGLHGSAFLRKNAKAADADRLDGKDSSDFLAAGGTAVNSDKLGNQAASEYLRKCQDGAVQGRAEINGAEASTATWDSPGVVGVSSWVCTGESVRVKRVTTGTYQVVFGSVVHGNTLGYGTGSGPLPIAVSKESGKTISAYGPNQCAPGNPPSPYVICFTVQMRSLANVATDGSFVIALN